MSSFSSRPNRLGFFIIALICGGNHGRRRLEKLNKFERKEKNAYDGHNRSRNIQQDVMIQKEDTGKNVKYTSTSERVEKRRVF